MMGFAASPDLDRARIVCIALSFCSWMCGGCSSPSSDGGEPAVNPAKPESYVAKEPVVDAVAFPYAQAFEQAVANRNLDAVNRMMDWRRLTYEATDGVPADAAHRASFRRGAERGLAERGMGAELVRVTSRGGEVRFLRLRQNETETRAVFRVVLADGAGLNYVELVLVEDPERGCLAIDFYSYLTAELATETVRRNYLLTVEGWRAEAGVEKQITNNVEALEGYLRASREGKSAIVLEKFETLPESLRQEKFVLLAKLKAASQASDGKFLDALTEYREVLASDPAVNMLLVDDYLLTQRYDDAIACLDRVDEAVGGDPYLKIERAGVLVAKRDLEGAKSLVERAIKEDDSLEHAYWVAVTISLRKRDFAETARVLERVRKRFDLRLQSDLSEFPEYAEFVKSEHYESWRRSVEGEGDSDAEKGRVSSEGDTPTTGGEGGSDKESSEGPDARRKEDHGAASHGVGGEK